MTQVKALQNDTMDSVAYRYYGSSSTAMLPALLEANPGLESVTLNQHQVVNLPVITEAQQSQTLKLWD